MTTTEFKVWFKNHYVTTHAFTSSEAIILGIAERIKSGLTTTVTKVDFCPHDGNWSEYPFKIVDLNRYLKV